MNPRIIVPAIVLVVFSIFTAQVVCDFGYFGLLVEGFGNGATSQITIDLVIACIISLGWIHKDAKENNLTVWPFFAMTLTLGSIGLLSYLMCREARRGN